MSSVPEAMAQTLEASPPNGEAKADAIGRRPRRRRLRWLSLLCLPTLVVALGATSLFTVDVTQYALVIRFGAVVQTLREPGLHFKAPFDRLVRLDKRLMFSRPGKAEYLTVDKHNVVVESLATWRITDPQRYYTGLRGRAEAEARLADIVLGEIGAVLGVTPVQELIAPGGDVAGYRRRVDEIRQRVAAVAQRLYGIAVADVELLQVTLPEQNRVHVFDRMKAERDKMAKEFRTVGALYARKIVAEADRERTRIEAESSARASRIRAEGDAEAARIYAAAFAQDPRFYKFLRTLEAYGKVLDESTTVFLPAEAEVLRVLRGGERTQLEAHPGTTSTARTKTGNPARAVSLAPGGSATGPVAARPQ